MGASGSGVTTLGKKLAAMLGLPYFDSDEYFWQESEPPFTIKRAPEQRNDLITADLQKHDHWILGGSVIDWDASFPAFDLIVFLWIPRHIRIERLKKRELEKYGEVILTDPARNKQFIDFINWAKGYDEPTSKGRTLLAHRQWLGTQTCDILEIAEDISVERRAEIVMARLK